MGIFLLALLVGILSLVGGLFLTRQGWRPELPAFGRHSRFFDIALHPERYATAESLPRIRFLNLLGGAALAMSLGSLGYEALRSWLSR